MFMETPETEEARVMKVCTMIEDEKGAMENHQIACRGRALLEKLHRFTVAQFTSIETETLM